MRLGLQARYALTLLGLTVAVVVLLTGALLLGFRATDQRMRESGQTVTRAALVSQIEKQGRGLATHLAENLTNPLYQLDMQLIQLLLRSAAMQEDVVHAYVFDASRLVLHDGTESIENYGLLLNDAITRQVVTAGIVASTIGNDTLDVAAPIVLGSNRLGGVHVSLSLAGIQGDIADLQTTLNDVSRRGLRDHFLLIGGTLGAVILLALCLSVWVARGLTRPIESLTGLTRRIGRGVYDIEIPFERRDEIGELARALKDMAGRLQATTVSKGYLDNILNSMLDPLLVFRVDGTVEGANAAACRLLDLDLNRLVGRHINDILHREPGGVESFDTGRDGLGIDRSTGEGAIVGADGGRIPVLISWSVMSSQRDDTHQILCVARDITERKNTEEALRDSEERFRSLVANSPSAIVLKDLGGRVALVNQRFEEWYGLSAPDVCGRNLFDVLPKGYGNHLAEQDQRVLETGCTVEREFEVPFADGTPHSVIVTMFPVLGSDGRIMGVASLHTDVTTQRKTEAQLRQASKMKAVGQLTGGVAHDFNNLLAVIMGNTEILEERLQPEDKQVHAIMHAAIRGAELTQRLLAFSRRQPLAPQAIDIDSLLSGMSDLLSRTLGETIEIKTLSDPELWRAAADPGQLENALLNLAINARDAMPSGGKLIIEARNLTLEPHDLVGQSEVIAGDYVLLSVRDNGSGIPASALQHVFEPFFTTKEAGQGSGLGLSMVYGFAKQSGGHVTIESEENAGTTVTLALPRATGAVDQAEDGPGAPEPRGRGETVLVVEDVPDVRELAVTLLERLGYRVRTAADGREGLAVLDEFGPVDLILSDVILPGAMSGPEFVARAQERHPAIRALFMSGFPEVRADAEKRLGADSILLAKPFRRTDLAEKLRAALDRAAARTRLAG